MKFILGMIFLFFGLALLLPGILALIVGIIGGIFGLIVGIFATVIGIVASIFGAIFGSIIWLTKGLLIAGLIVLGVYLIAREGNGRVHSRRSHS